MAAADKPDKALDVTRTIVRDARKRIEALEAALRPFANFAATVKEWRRGDGEIIQKQLPASYPIARGAVPVSSAGRNEEVVLLVGDFLAAEYVLKGGV